MPLEQERRRPPKGGLPLRQARTEYIVHIPHEKAKREQTSARAEKVGNHRPLLGGDSLGGRGELEDVGYTEGGGDNERGENDLMIDRISVNHASFALSA